MQKTPTLLMILDGCGTGVDSGAWTADLPRLDRLRREFASTVLSAAGPDAGLPPGVRGNREAGYLQLGAGRIVTQPLLWVENALADGSFYQNPRLLYAMEQCREAGTALHLPGLLSDDGFHAHTDCLFALLRMAKDQGLKRVYVHAFTDGSTGGKLDEVSQYCQNLGVGTVATVMDHRFAMDEREQWDLVEAAYDTLIYGEASAGPAGPVLLDPEGAISDHDSVIFWNLRPASVRELAAALADPLFSRFTRQIFPLHCVSMTACGVPGVQAAFGPPPVPERTLGAYLGQLGLTQLRLAAAEQYPLATTFFNGWAPEPYEGEERIEVLPEAPGFSGHVKALRNVCLSCMESGSYDLMVLGFPSVPLEGGRLDPAGLETLDACLGVIAEETLQMGGIAMITSCCGGTEDQVPFLLCGAGSHLRPGRLADVAPTLLDVMGLACPEEMDGRTLIVE